MVGKAELSQSKIIHKNVLNTKRAQRSIFLEKKLDQYARTDI